MTCGFGHRPKRGGGVLGQTPGSSRYRGAQLPFIAILLIFGEFNSALRRTGFAPPSKPHCSMGEVYTEPEAAIEPTAAARPSLPSSPGCILAAPGHLRHVRRAEHHIHIRRPQPSNLAWRAIYVPNSPNRPLTPDRLGLALLWWSHLVRKMGLPGVRVGRSPLCRPPRGAAVRVQGSECSEYLFSI